MFITGTGTGTGKTAAFALLVAAFRENGVSAAPFKPVAAGVEKRRVSRSKYGVKRPKAAKKAA